MWNIYKNHLRISKNKRIFYSYKYTFWFHPPSLLPLSTITNSHPQWSMTSPYTVSYRILDILLTTANDLKDVNLFTKMDVYGYAVILNNLNIRKEIPIVKNGGRNPKLNHFFQFLVQDYVKGTECVLWIQLRSAGKFFDRPIGEVYIQLEDLQMEQPLKNISFPVTTSSGKAKGKLNMRYMFRQYPFKKPRVENTIRNWVKSQKKLAREAKHAQAVAAGLAANPPYLVPPLEPECPSPDLPVKTPPAMINHFDAALCHAMGVLPYKPNPHFRGDALHMWCSDLSLSLSLTLFYFKFIIRYWFFMTRVISLQLKSLVFKFSFEISSNFNVVFSFCFSISNEFHWNEMSLKIVFFMLPN